MPTQTLTTQFAPAERIPIELVRRQAQTVAQSPVSAQLLNSVLNYVFVLNPQRQIVFSSKNVRGLLPGGGGEELLGLRPGELLNCIHGAEQPGGCGTSLSCGECGALKAILSSLGGQAAAHECRITRRVNNHDESLDLLVYGSPLQFQDQTYALIAVTDISHEKRRLALERIFFHDLVNSAGGLANLAELLSEDAPAPMQNDLRLLRAGFNDLLEEILAQRDLASAESGELALRMMEANSTRVIDQVVQLYQKHLIARDREIRRAPDAPALTLITDPVLLKRVLGNLVKNALEAVKPGGLVTVGCDDAGARIRFWVQNPGAMSDSAKLQVFQRSFSTKGLGRGLGTYSVKLLTERYLDGQAGFTSDPEHGTIFFINIPKIPSA